jgi:hypothetical protein
MQDANVMIMFKGQRINGVCLQSGVVQDDEVVSDWYSRPDPERGIEAITVHDVHAEPAGRAADPSFISVVELDLH